VRVSRKDASLNDAIEALDDKFISAQNISKTELEALPRAWDSLHSDELAFIDLEIERCITDRRYYMENYHVIRNENGVVQTLYPFWSHQEIIYEAVQSGWDRDGCFQGIILKPRQSGGTTWTAALIFHDTIFVPQAYSLSMAQDDRVSLEMFNRMMDAYHALPWWLKPEYLSKQQGLHIIFQRSDEGRRIVDPGLGSTLIVSNAQKATGVAIGRTLRSGHFSEVSRWPDSSVWTADIEPSMNARDILAIMESTAYGRTGLFYNMWQAAESGKSEWTPIFIPAYKVKKHFVPLRAGETMALTEEEGALRRAVAVKEKFQIPLGFFKWRRRKIVSAVSATGAEDDHYESYPCTSGEAFISSGFCAFPRKELNRQQRENCIDPIAVGEIEYVSMDAPPILHLHQPTLDELMDKPAWNNRFWVWEYPRDGSMDEYYLGCDVGGPGDDDDFSDIAVYRLGYGAEPDTQVCEWHGHMSPAHLSRVVAAIAHWYNDCEVAVEYARDGITTANDLQWVIDFPNLYRWKRMDKISNTITQHTHWVTNAQTRDDAINRMAERLLDHTIVIRNKHTIEEMRDFGRYEDETKAAGIENDDDAVMANIICICASHQGGKRAELTDRMAMGTGANSSTAGGVMPKAPLRFTIYDHYGRMVEDVDSEDAGKVLIAKLEAKYKMKLPWRIVPVVVQKANTPWSPIFDAPQSAEGQLYRQGMDSKHITPDIVQAYRDILVHRHYDGYEEE